ncbi:site-specific integrase [Pseudoalteromonas tetraodonis]|uniref:site-specific integrase n=1 Tax=Pseudoalteromonas tetraodonis TaxID=43659 RepID=UPI000AFE8A24|nr:site-specific integrase [Pseudoalteromonas tetraodonis]
MVNAMKQYEAKKQSSLKVSKDGYSFDPSENRWHLNKDTVISFQEDVINIEPQTYQSFKKVLARYAQQYSARHAFNMYQMFQRMLRDTECNVINVQVIRNWRAMLDDEHEWYLGALRGFLISWYDFGYKGINKEVVDVLEKMTLAGNKKGVAIANRCPETGALTQNEQIAVTNELIDLFTKGHISLECYAYFLILQATARRPVQIRQLKSKDLLRNEGTNGAVNYYLNFPRAKQRGVGFRKEFNKLAITEELYLILKNLVCQQEDWLTEQLERPLTKIERSLVPFFIDKKCVTQILPSTKGGDTFLDVLDSDFAHMSVKQLESHFMKKVNRLNQSISERTGEIIPLTARRFRRTRGTNLGRKGVSAFIIAEALDQSDTQNVKVYAENTADTVTYIDKAVGKQLAPFAKAFKGEVIDTLAGAERGEDPTAQIPNRESEAVGACGTNDFCIKGYEACYLCEKFRPLVDAPHQKFLDSLYAEKEARLKTTKSEEYASTKDTLILAVEAVVEACNKTRAEQGV